MAAALYYRVYVQAGPSGYDLSPNLTVLRLEESEGRANQLRVMVSDPHKVISHAVQEGMEIEVDIGTTDDHSVVFRGMIYRTEGNFPRQEVPTVTLLAYDKSMEMGLRRRNRVFTDMSLTELVEEIAGEYFSTDTINVSLVGEPNFTGNGIRQQNETDLAFLLRLAERYGCEMFVLSEEDDSSLNFIAQHQIMNQVPDVTLYHGRCGAPARLLSFRATSDVGDIQLPRTLSGIDGDTGELLEAETSEISETQETEDAFRDENLTAFVNEETERNTAINELAGAAGTVQDALRERLGTVRMEPTQGFLTQEELSVRAENQFSTSLHGMRGNGTAEGNHRVQAQTTIGIADVGGRFSNIWYLSEVRHIIDRNGYKTEFDCKR